MADEPDTLCAKCNALHSLSDLRKTVGGKLLCIKCAPSLFLMPAGRLLPLSAPTVAFNYAILWTVLTFLSAGCATYYFAKYSYSGDLSAFGCAIVFFIAFVVFGPLIGIVVLIFRKLIG